MYSSIISGETTYLLQDLQSLRTSIADQAQLIDTLSKKIATIPEEDKMPKAAVLKSSIRKATSIYIKDYLLTLPSPPTLQELEKIRNERSFSTNRTDDIFPAPKINIKKVAVTTGWSPANVSSNPTTSDAEDPLLEQINIVKNYVDQARMAQRFDEAASLTENLKMLKDMYQQQQYQSKR